MHPTLFEIGSRAVPSHGFFQTLGYLASIVLILLLAKKQKLPLVDIAAYALFGLAVSILGGKLYLFILRISGDRSGVFPDARRLFSQRLLLWPDDLASLGRSLPSPRRAGSPDAALRIGLEPGQFFCPSHRASEEEIRRAGHFVGHSHQLLHPVCRRVFSRRPGTRLDRPGRLSVFEFVCSPTDLPDRPRRRSHPLCDIGQTKTRFGLNTMRMNQPRPTLGKAPLAVFFLAGAVFYVIFGRFDGTLSQAIIGIWAFLLFLFTLRYIKTVKGKSPFEPDRFLSSRRSVLFSVLSSAGRRPSLRTPSGPFDSGSDSRTRPTPPSSRHPRYDT